KKIFITTISIVIVGVLSLTLFQLNPGIDFTSGSRVEVLADDSISVTELESDLEELDVEAKSLVLSGENNEIAVMRYDSVLSEAEIAKINEFFMDKYEYEPSVSVVSPIVGQELVKNAIYALAIAAVGIIIYVTLRFELFFALTAIIALLHDVFFMLVIFSVTRIEF